jgi:hypothetical protein
MTSVITNNDFLNNIKNKNYDIQEYYLNLSTIENKKQKKFSYKFTSDEDIFYDLLSHTQSLFNAFLFKIVDLNYGLISSINSKSYSSSIVISRTIFEVISMVFYVNDKLEKQLKINNYFETYKLLANFSVSIGSIDKIVNYKRIHVNDAIRFFAEEIINFDKKYKDFDKLYLDMYSRLSELSHPAPTSLLVYMNENNESDELQTKRTISFSMQSERFQSTFWMIAHTFSLLKIFNIMLYENEDLQIVKDLKDKKVNIINFYKFNPLEKNKLASLFSN